MILVTNAQNLVNAFAFMANLPIVTRPCQAARICSHTMILITPISIAAIRIFVTHEGVPRDAFVILTNFFPVTNIYRRTLAFKTHTIHGTDMPFRARTS
jgi:hypothetical protein